MSGESDKIERDPNKRSFWKLKNIAALALVAVIPAFCGWAWNLVSDAYKTLDTLKDRVKTLEDDRANNKAVWDAMTQTRNDLIKLQIETEVNRRLLEMGLSKHTIESPKTVPDKPATPPDPKIPRTEQRPLSPEEYRNMLEQKFPNDPVKKK